MNKTLDYVENRKIDYSKRVGETRTMKNGLKATIIVYKSSMDVDIQFENGEIIKHKSYAEFIKGHVGLTNLRTATLLAQKRHLGEKRIMNNGMEAELIEYNAKENVTIKFEDGVIKPNVLYNAFKKGTVAHPHKTTENIKAEKKYINQIAKMNNGMFAEIISYKASKNIDIKFEDGIIVKNRSLDDFKRGSIAHPTKPQTQRYKNQQSKIGEINYASNGQKMKIIKYNSCQDIDVQFEDGTIVKNVRYDSFAKGTIANPNYLLLSGVSHNELIIAYYLESYGFSKSRLPEIDGKEMDLYNPNFYGYKIGIEYDGYVNIHDNSHSIEKDIKKNELCVQNNIHLFRIREPQLPLLNSSSVDIKLSSKKRFSHSLELAIKTLIDKLENLCGIKINADIDFERDKMQIFEYIKKYHNKSEKEKVGQKIMMNCGMYATIIEYINSENVSIQFEDGTIRKNISYYAFRNGKCKHPCINTINAKTASKYIGQEKLMKNGLNAKIIKYRNYEDIDVQFEDGVVIQHTNTSLFNNGHIKREDTISIKNKRNRYINQKAIMNNGLLATIIEYRNYEDIDIQFENGVIVKNKRCDNFMRGKIKCPA